MSLFYARSRCDDIIIIYDATLELFYASSYTRHLGYADGRRRKTHAQQRTSVSARREFLFFCASRSSRFCHTCFLWQGFIAQIADDDDVDAF